MNAEHRLATYGTLAPGRRNHHQLIEVNGQWLTGSIRGRLVAAGWGASMGYPALVLAEDAPLVEVQILESIELPEHWTRLDEFEGSEYQRVTAIAQTPAGELPVSVYVLRASDPSMIKPASS
jgi:gamma-glutamylcyclotransferase (GGCT)/AIG2-like uncharacterized protein YtfP